MSTVSVGKYGEDAAAEYLAGKGCKILRRNYKAANGEIDIIAKSGKKLMFVEVKTRKNTKFGYAGDAVNYRKQHKIINTARAFVISYTDYDEISFDVCEVYTEEHRINYIRNCLRLGVIFWNILTVTVTHF